MRVFIASYIASDRASRHRDIALFVIVLIFTVVLFVIRWEVAVGEIVSPVGDGPAAHEVCVAVPQGLVACLADLYFHWSVFTEGHRLLGQFERSSQPINIVFEFLHARLKFRRGIRKGCFSRNWLLRIILLVLGFDIAIDKLADSLYRVAVVCYYLLLV